jgi:hypothetical protein
MKRFIPIIAIIVLLTTAGVVLAFSAVQLDSPLANSTIKLNPVNFSWFETKSATRYILKVRNLATSEVYSYSLAPSNVCAWGYCTYTVPRNLKNGQYRWWVVTRFTDGSTMPSAKRLFTMKLN